MSYFSTALIAGAAFLLTLGAGVAFVRLGARTQHELARRGASQLAIAYASALEKLVDHAYAAGVGIATGAPLVGQPDTFRGIAADVVHAFPIVRVVAVAQAGVIRLRFPDTDAAGFSVGQDLFADAHVGPDAREARDTGRLRLSGPHRRAREILLFGFLPTRDTAASRSDNLTVVAIRMSDLVTEARIAELGEHGYDYELIAHGTRGQDIRLAQSTEIGLDDAVRLPVRLPDRLWTLAVSPRGGWLSDRPHGGIWGLVIVIAAAVAGWVFDVLRRPAALRREVERRTEHLVRAHREVTRAILQRDRAEQKLLHEASHDSLTGLPNRGYLLTQIGRALEASTRDGACRVGVVVLGLDRFTLVNESRGPSAGDSLLVGVARRFTAALRPDDVLARTGGDEFAVVLPNVTDIDGPAVVAQRLLSTLDRPFEIHGSGIHIDASGGVAVSDQNPDDAASLLRDAGLALHRAKSAGGRRIEVFAKEMHAGVVRRMQIEADLRVAIERRQLCAYFEPVISLETGRIISFEALARWEHPEQGLISPGVFVPVAEASGLIVDVDRAIWRGAAEHIRALHQRTPRQHHVSVSVNLSARHLMAPDLVDCVADVLETSGFAPSFFRIEITESMMMENAAIAIDVMTRLKALGIRLLLDDFGTGYSSLSYLHELPVDVIKIDRSFIDRLTSGDKHVEIVRAIIALGAQLGLDVIAEGLSTDEQLLRLRELGCPFAQGWLFSKPVPHAQLDDLVDPSRTYTPWHVHPAA